VAKDYRLDRALGAEPTQWCPEGSAPVELTPGTLISGRFRIESDVTVGSALVVYRALDTVTRESVRLEMVLPEVAADPATSAELLDVTLATRRLRHPNILSIFDIGEHAGRVFWTADGVDTVPLSEYLERDDWRTTHLSVRIQLLCDIASGAALAAESGLFPDVRAQSLVIDEHGRPLIIAVSRRHVDLVVALGELLRAVVPAPPSALAAIIERTAGQGRYRDASEVRDALLAVLHGGIASDPRPLPLRHPTRSKMMPAQSGRGGARIQRYWPLALGAAAIVVGAAGVAWYAFDSSQETVAQKTPSEARELANAPVGVASDMPTRDGGPAKLSWVGLAAGAFSIGSVHGEPTERPVHSVNLPLFHVTRTEITVAQYRRCVTAGACAVPAQKAGCSFTQPTQSDHPVNCVSWRHAVNFCRWAGGRLPTESEWERGAGEHKFPWGEQDASCDRAVMKGCGSGTATVCSAGAGSNGLCDMGGNVAEWTEDAWVASYDGASTTGTARAGGTERVFRGGSFQGEPKRARSSSRQYVYSGYAGPDVGFRCAAGGR
jgi:formylglycine-generating enzyme required for sulfatase activity